MALSTIDENGKLKIIPDRIIKEPETKKYLLIEVKSEIEATKIVNSWYGAFKWTELSRDPLKKEAFPFNNILYYEEEDKPGGSNL